MSRNAAWFLAGVATMVAMACGGGGGDPAPATPAPPAAVVRTNILFLGNSLTYLPTDATYVPGSNDWGPGGWGMAASAPEKDFAHIVAKAQGLPFTAMNLAENERNSAAPLPAFTVGAGTVVVLQLGDNGLAARYGELVQRAKAGARLVCVSAWGPTQRDRDAVMKPLCEAGGGTWVDISDLYAIPSMVSWYAHPGDEAMAHIATRINAALEK